jgi:hypothetical protein
VEEMIQFVIADPDDVWLDYTTVFCKIPERVSQEAQEAGPFIRRAMLTEVTGRVTSSVVMAGTVGLHHATWTVTDDPEQVLAIGRVCGCAPCISGMDQTAAWMAANPGRCAGVGQHWWSR